MPLTPGRRKKSKEHDDHIPHKWGKKFMVIQWVMYVCLGELVTSCYWSWSGKKLIKRFCIQRSLSKSKKKNMGIKK